MRSTLRNLMILSVLSLMLLSLGTAHAAPSAAHFGQTTSRIDLTGLRIPQTAFTPASTYSTGGDMEASTEYVDNGKFFRYYHPNGYASLGRVDGYYQSAQWVPTLGADTVVFRYLGSIYPSGQVASNAYDALKPFFAGTLKAPLTPCCASTNISAVCDDIALVFANGSVVYYREVQVGVCVAEVAVTINTKAEADANRDQIVKTNDAITLAAVAAMNKVCVTRTPTITITGLGVTHRVKGKVSYTTELRITHA